MWSHVFWNTMYVRWKGRSWKVLAKNVWNGARAVGSSSILLLLSSYMNTEKQRKHTAIKQKNEQEQSEWMQAGRTVQWDKQKCGAITYDYVQQTYKIKSSISDLSSDIPFDRTLAWSRRSSNSHRKRPDCRWARVTLKLWIIIIIWSGTLHFVASFLK